MQGPSQAPTKAGVSTVGLGEREAKFIEACYNADVESIESMMEEDFVASVTDVNGRSALHFCAGNGLPTLCTKLMDRGATMDKQDVLGFTPLHMATGYVKLDTVKLLVERGADANIASFDGKLAVEIAEDMFEKTPAKQFFRANPTHEKLKEMVDVLDEATEVEEEDEEEEGLEEENGVTRSVNEFGDITEETENAKFVVRVKPRGEASSGNGIERRAVKVDDVKVTIKIKEAEKKA